MAGEKKPKSKCRHRSVQIWKRYKEGKFAGRWCPRCGPGSILAAHVGRMTCGKCRYSEIQKK